MVTYGIGDWHLVVSGGGIALLPPGTGADDLMRIWRDMRDGDAFAVTLSVLLQKAGPNMAALPDFAVVTASEASARVIVRGGIRARVATADGTMQEVAALGVPTWTDRTISGTATVTLGLQSEAETVLPLDDGVAAASCVRWALDEPAPVTPARSVTPALVPGVPVPDAPAPAPQDATAPSAVGDAAVDDAVVDDAVVDDATVDDAASDVTLAPVLPDEDSMPADDRVDGNGERLADAEQPPAASLEETTGYDDLIFGETRLSTVEDAAVRAEVDDHEPVASAPSAALAVPGPPPPPAPVPRAPQAGGLVSGVPPAPAPGASVAPGDHDGETISAEQLEALRARLDKASPADLPPVQPIGAAAVLVVSTGDRVTLDRSAVVGRRPRAVRATGAVPHLVTVPSVEREISSNHVELRVEGSDVIAVDLDTMNGTRLLRVGAEPVRLHPGEPTLLVTGDRLDLGDGIVLGFEGI